METFIPKLVSLLNPSLQVLDQTQTGVYLISRLLAKYFINNNSHNSTTSHNIDVKVRPVNKIKKRFILSNSEA